MNWRLVVAVVAGALWALVAAKADTLPAPPAPVRAAHVPPPRCEFLHLSARDERATCAILAAEREWRAANPEPVKPAKRAKGAR